MKSLTVIRGGELAFGVNLTLARLCISNSILWAWYFNLSIAPSGPLCTEKLRGKIYLIFFFTFGQLTPLLRNLQTPCSESTREMGYICEDNRKYNSRTFHLIVTPSSKALLDLLSLLLFTFWKECSWSFTIYWEQDCKGQVEACRDFETNYFICIL